AARTDKRHTEAECDAAGDRADTTEFGTDTEAVGGVDMPERLQRLRCGERDGGCQNPGSQAATVAGIPIPLEAGHRAEMIGARCEAEHKPRPQARERQKPR